MSSAILPVAYFGSIDYFSVALKYDAITFEAHESYQKQSCRNRTQILSAQGPISLIIPVKTSKTSKSIRFCTAEESPIWKRTHLRSLQTAYQSAPFFDHYWPAISAFFEQTHKDLINCCVDSFDLCCQLMKVDIKWKLSETYLHETPNDYRTTLGARGWPTPLKDQQAYEQVFSDRLPFAPNMSVLDLIFNLGPESKEYLFNCH